MKLNGKHYLLKLTLGFVFMFLMGSTIPDMEEGMYPLSEIKKLNLKEAGLKIDIEDIYNPNGVSLIDALVNLSGCTGSFVSDKGLILTNHHCAFGAINRASTTENNYLENGFHAAAYEDEIPAGGIDCRITESYEDVTDRVLAAVEGVDDLAERAKLIEKEMNAIEEEYNDPENSIEARVSEMFTGQSYVLFKYRVIKDVRLVYAPPQSIGNFGGESDNWVWPRHTGDFSILRAYVAPDGSAATYSEENVPYTPKKHLQVNPDGVDEEDFVFILGYPARTYRHNPSQFLEYRQNYFLPYYADLYEWTIETVENMSEGDPEMELKYASFNKSLANRMKRYKGQMLGIRRINLIEKKQQEEEEIKKFIRSDEELNEKYGGLFEKIAEAYDERMDYVEANLWLGGLEDVSPTMRIAIYTVENAHQMQKDEEDRGTWFQEKNLMRMVAYIWNRASYYNEDIEREVLTMMLEEAATLEGENEINAVSNLFDENTEYEEIERFVEENLLNAEVVTDRDYFDKLFTMTPEELAELDDPVIDFAIQIWEQANYIREKNDKFEGAMSKLLPELNEVKRLKDEQDFIPDANRTLRLTYGYVRGYSPRNAVYYEPLTTLDGVIDKSYINNPDYETPEKLHELYENEDWGQFYDEDLGGVPVALLYNMDTTGGNSGSPIMDAYGRMIGINFDRAYEATINDYAWDESYSRSIGVDIRYVLWVTQKYGGADHLLEEMGVN